MVGALLTDSLYNIASFRRLYSAISESVALRWFCFLTIDDQVFGHSSIGHHIDRIGREGFATFFDGCTASSVLTIPVASLGNVTQISGPGATSNQYQFRQ